MWTYCLKSTSVLLVASLASKLFVDDVGSRCDHAVQVLIDKALHWRSVALNDSDPLNAYHHLIVSLTFVQSARELMSDAHIESHVGVDVPVLMKELEKKIAKKRQNIRPQTRK